MTLHLYLLHRIICSTTSHLTDWPDAAKSSTSAIHYIILMRYKIYHNFYPLCTVYYYVLTYIKALLGGLDSILIHQTISTTSHGIGPQVTRVKHLEPTPTSKLQYVQHHILLRLPQPTLHQHMYVILR